MADSGFDLHLSRRKFLNTGLASGTALAMGGLVGCSISPLVGAYPTVNLASGPIQGEQLGIVDRYLGIPYAQSIAGKNRFLPPQPVKPWTGVSLANRFADSSPQQPQEMATPVTPSFAPPDYVKAGDQCLALNVWAPQRAEKLPVMVWLHGGGWVSGSGSCQVYDGEQLARRGDVIVVTLNHRLGLSGLTDLSRVIGGEYEGSANLAVQDMVAALRWVRDNISAFGGDPDRVTIFGESGGGWKVATLLGCVPAKGLFHRAIIQSGPMTGFMKPEKADDLARLVLKELGVSQPEQLGQLSTQAVIDAEARVLEQIPMGTPGFPAGFWPVLDDTWLPEHVFEGGAAKTTVEVPMMIGQNGTEFSLFMLADKAAYQLTPEALEQRVSGLFDDRVGAAIIDSYRSVVPDYDASGLWFRIYSDYVMGAISLSMTDAKVAASQAPVYAYRFEWQTPLMNGKLYSPHTIEIPFVFDNVTTTGKQMAGLSPGMDSQALEGLAGQVSEAWVNFAKTGKPSAPGLPDWPEYNPDTRPAMHLDLRSDVAAYMPLAWVDRFKEQLWRHGKQAF